MQKPTLDPEEWMVSLKDVKMLYISMWKKLLNWAFIGAIVSFLYFASQEVRFEAFASFKQGVERPTIHGNFLRDFIGTMHTETKPEAASIMKSNRVLRPLVEKMGLQINPIVSKGYISKCIDNIREAYKAEKGKAISDLDGFAFRNVASSIEEPFLEEPFEFHLFFKNEREFLVFDEDKKKLLAQGVVGVPVEFDSIRFTIQKTPKELKNNSYYPFAVQHWSVAVGSLSSLFKIEEDEDNPSLINVSIKHRDRFLAQDLVNGLMIEYQGFLKNEFLHVAKEQLNYLESRQDEIFQKMDHLFDEHAEYLGKNLEQNGFTGHEQEGQSLLIPHQQMYGRLLTIDAEISRIDQIEKEGKITAFPEDSPFSSKFSQILQNINLLKQERDLLELSLCQDHVQSLETKKRELNELRSQRMEVEKLIQEVNLGQEISAFEFHEGLSLWAKAIKDPQELIDFHEYLENYARLLSIREKILHDRFFHGNTIPEELEGIDLNSAKGLYLGYNSKLDEAQARIRHFEKLKEEIPNQQFKLAPLNSVLVDALSQRLINEASDLEFKIKDEKHRTSSEERRWVDEISCIRKMLVDHLNQLIIVEELNANLFREKMTGLQQVSLDSINRQLSVLDEQGAECVRHRKQSLLIEKELLNKEMVKLRKSLAETLPEKWRFEEWLQIKTGMISRIMQTITEVFESKTMSTQMHHVESKPLDVACLPKAPKPPHLMNMAYLGGFAFSVLVFSMAFIRKIFKGFPLSIEKIKALKLPCLGPISSACDGSEVETPTGPDLNLLRQITLFSEGAQVIGLIGGRGPDYTYALGENLARRHTKSIIVRCDFLSTYNEKDAPGILQVWKKETAELPIRKGKGFDYINAGGFSPFGTEIIQSENFSNLIGVLKKNYTWVYLFFRTPLSSAESIAALRLCEKAVVTVCSEETEELTPFVDWGYDANRCRLTFITRS